MRMRVFLPILRSVTWLLFGMGLVGAIPNALLTAEETAPVAVPRFALHEFSFEATGNSDNPYVQMRAVAELTNPDGDRRELPLFWDGGQVWRLRISPDVEGPWSFVVHSADSGLDGQAAKFECVASNNRGSIQPMRGFRHHFQYQNGEPLWFMGDTAWALVTDSQAEHHDRAAAEAYVKARAAQGFSAVHTMLLSEAGWENSGGPPFESLADQTLNPAYWQEVDARIAFANAQGLVVGLAIAWGDKGRQERFAWRMFPDLDARLRYAEYIAARYGAMRVYFIVSGEWHAEVRSRSSSTEAVMQEFVRIGDALQAADAHERMLTIHPMTAQGSVREFNDTRWMSFGDYQQNYRDLHARVLESRRFDKPVVNSEYGYHLRDSDGDGTPDKDNSTSLDAIRYASWDIAMAGGYLVTGFGTTYFGGHRDPGPFNLEAEQNDDWEAQIQLLPRTFTGLPWWRLEPHDDWLTCSQPRGDESRQFGRVVPPQTTYWLLADPGQNYVAYARGITQPLIIQLGAGSSDDWKLGLINPRSGATAQPRGRLGAETYHWQPPDDSDWVLRIERKDR